MASAKVATKAAADDRTDMVIPHLCALQAAAPGFPWAAAQYGATAWWPPSSRDPEEPTARFARRESHDAPRKPHRQSTRLRPCVEWDSYGQLRRTRPAVGQASSARRHGARPPYRT